MDIEDQTDQQGNNHVALPSNRLRDGDESLMERDHLPKLMNIIDEVETEWRSNETDAVHGQNDGESLLRVDALTDTGFECATCGTEPSRAMAIKYVSMPSEPGDSKLLFTAVYCAECTHDLGDAIDEYLKANHDAFDEDVR